MKRVMWAAAAAAIAVGGVASAQKAQPQADPARLSDYIKTLSSDAFEGRAPATEESARRSPISPPSIRPSAWRLRATTGPISRMCPFGGS